MDNNKIFLDFQGLVKYDELVKKYIKNQAQLSEQDIKNVVQALAEYKNATDALLQEAKEAIESNSAAIETLNGDADTEGSVANQVKAAVDTAVDTAVEQAIDTIVANADQAFDTLKEVADWIQSDGAAAVELINKVSENTEAIEKNAADISETKNGIKTLKDYVDERDECYYNAIQSISDASIGTLFMSKVTVAEDESVATAIEALKENEMLVLTSDCAENLNIPADVVIDASGNTLSGDITVAEGATVMNAIFTGVVTVK